MLYPFGYKIKTKHQQYTSMGIICLYLLEVLYYAHTFFKRIIQPYYTFSNVYHPLHIALHFFKRIKRKPYKSFQVL